MSQDESKELAERIREYAKSLGADADPKVTAMLSAWADEAEELKAASAEGDDEPFEVRLIQWPDQNRVCIAWCRYGEDLNDMLDEESDPSGHTETLVKNSGLVSFAADHKPGVGNGPWDDFVWMCTPSESVMEELPNERLMLLRDATFVGDLSWKESIRRHQRIEKVARGLLKRAAEVDFEKDWNEVFGRNPWNPVMDVKRIESTDKKQRAKRS